jgi:hypothetical protein
MKEYATGIPQRTDRQLRIVPSDLSWPLGMEFGSSMVASLMRNRPTYAPPVNPSRSSSRASRSAAASRTTAPGPKTAVTTVAF